MTLPSNLQSGTVSSLNPIKSLLWWLSHVKPIEIPLKSREIPSTNPVCLRWSVTRWWRFGARASGVAGVCEAWRRTAVPSTFSMATWIFPRERNGGKLAFVVGVKACKR